MKRMQLWGMKERKKRGKKVERQAGFDTMH